MVNIKDHFESPKMDVRSLLNNSNDSVHPMNVHKFDTITGTETWLN